MIDVYSHATPNGQKVHIMLEETGLEWRLHPVSIRKGEQLAPRFLALNPNNKIPVIVDHQGPGGKPLTLAESGAILIYLAEKSGRLLPADPAARYFAIQWVMFQMAGIGPTFGQAAHFRKYAPQHVAADQLEYAVRRFTNEANRLYRVMNGELAKRQHIAGDYSIADIAIWTWVQQSEAHGVNIEDYPHVKRWFGEIAARPAVQRGKEHLLAERNRNVSQPYSKDEFEKLFNTQTA